MAKRTLVLVVQSLQRNVDEKVHILNIAVHGDCIVWLLTGSNELLRKYHKKENRMRHPGDQCIEFSNFLSCLQNVFEAVCVMHVIGIA